VSTLGGMFFIVGRLSSYMLFAIRLKIVFGPNKSIYSYGAKTFKTLYVMLSIQFVCFLFIMTGMVDNAFPNVNIQNSYFNLFFALGIAIYFILDPTFCILFPYLFIRKLLELHQIQLSQNHLTPTSSASSGHSFHFQPSNNNSSEINPSSLSPPEVITVNQNESVAKVSLSESEIIHTVTRISMLSFILFVSSEITLFVFMIGLSFGETALIIAEIILAIDSTLNCICVVLCFSYNNNLYLSLCATSHSYFHSQKLYLSFYKCCTCCCDRLCCCGYYLK
jgi:hypothetical protein